MSRFEPISVIEYQGVLSPTGVSQGHYICDVKNSSTNKWFRTNDNCEPIPLQECDVSKYGYVILFKRSTQ